MHQIRSTVALVSLLCGVGMALATGNLALTTHVGFNGYYRARTLVPVTVDVDNAGAKLRGEFRIVTDPPDGLQDTYRIPTTITAGVKSRYFFTVQTDKPFSALSVKFVSNGADEAVGTNDHIQQLSDYDRLMVVVGGTGSSLGIVRGQNIAIPDLPMPRAWDLSFQDPRLFGGSGYPSPRLRGGSSGTPGNVQLTYADAKRLPENPEAYGGVATLVLLSDVTANSLSRAAQDAITLWVTSGGHLIVAGGGVPSRLNDPFFRRLLPQAGSRHTIIDTTEVGTATTVAQGSGWATALNFDPDSTTLRDWKAVSKFYGRLAAKEPRTPITLPLQASNTLNTALSIRNLKPPDLKLIVIFLITYLIILVPVNYFILKRLDKRELAWLTTPAIVLVFTIGAYAIGYVTKGHRLVLNVVSIVETTAGQQAAEAISEAMIFSPSRTTYQMDLGEGALLAREIGLQQSYDRNTPGLAFTEDAGHLSVTNVLVNMWASRQFVTAHRLDLGQGFTAALTPGTPATTPRATGTVLNRTPYTFDLCELYLDGALVATFHCNPGETITVEHETGSSYKPKLNDDQLHMLDGIESQIKSQFTPGANLAQGFVLLAYSQDAAVPLRLNRQSPTTAMTLMVVHL